MKYLHHLLFSIGFFILSLQVASASATPGHTISVTTPAEFDSVKALVGKWEGSSKMKDGKDEKVKVTYELTSGGSAVVERLFVGTPHEMVSIYHPEGKKVVMTHYCMLGNQPKLTLKQASDKTLFFEMAGVSGIQNKKEPHMHSLKMNFNENKKEMTQEWTLYDQGKQIETTVIKLAKKK